MTVISAFPATGKTFVAGRDHRFIDSDSSSFSWVEGQRGRERNPDWPGNYLAHVEHSLRDGSHVLVSTHDEVRKALRDAGIPFVLVYPRFDLRLQYLDRMRDRGSPDWLVEKIGAMWAAMHGSLRQQTGCEHIELQPGQYLADVLPRAVATPFEKERESGA